MGFLRMAEVEKQSLNAFEQQCVVLDLV
jgi:hypothetical protein